MILTTEALVTDIPEPKAPPGAGRRDARVLERAQPLQPPSQKSKGLQRPHLPTPFPRVGEGVPH